MIVRRNRTPCRALIMLFSASCVMLLLALFLPACNSPSPSPVPLIDESDIADFTGNAACAECHAREFGEHKDSFHAMTLRPMTRAELGNLTPPVGPIPDSNNAIIERDGKLYFEVNMPNQPEQNQLWPLDLAFGTGKHAITPVHILEGRNVVEMKRSYAPHQGRWRVTPGKSVRNPAIGTEIHTLADSRACLKCHSVALSKNAFVPRREFFGVGCESCHGAGRAHIEAVRAGSTELYMKPLAKETPEEINTLCGRCHALEKDVINSPIRQKMTYRFHAYGLMISPCYLKSGKKLSCLNCHDSHLNASMDSNSYTPACLSCHSKPSSASPPPQGKSQTVCPVSPDKDCVKCHMPPRDYASATGEVTGIMMTEHRIGIYRDVAASAWLSGSKPKRDETNGRLP